MRRVTRAGGRPVGAYQVSLTEEQRVRVRETADALLGHPRSTFTLQASAWCAVGTVRTPGAA